jgi:LuxR family maltose regulon positive regulatory protein
MAAGVTEGLGPIPRSALQPAAARADSHRPMRHARVPPPPVVDPPSVAGIPAALLARARRPRLSTLLGRILHPTTRLGVVAAPPGYGKSVAVAGWAADTGLDCAWTTLDATCGDPVVLAGRLLQRVAPFRPAATEARLAAAAAGNPRAAALVVLGALSSDDGELLLVLDDWHLAETAEADAFLGTLLDGCPPFLHPVVVGREDPGVPLARLRAHGSLVEVRARDLRFTEAEAGMLLDGAGAGAADGLADLVRATEGWAAGIQLAALAAQGRGRTARVAADDRNLVDYLADEVLVRLDRATRDALGRLAVPERFPPALAAVVTGRDDAPALLDHLRRENRFLELDEVEPGWYRLHRLFAACLRAQLPAPTRRDVHRQVADWLHAHDLARLAVPHLLEGRHPDAQRRIADVGRLALEAGELRLLQEWTAALGEPVVEAEPDLAVLEAWRRFFVGDLRGASELGERAAARTGPSAALGRLRILRAMLESTIDARCEADGLEGIALVGDDLLFRSLGLQAVGLGRLVRGAFVEAADTLREALEVGRRSGVAIAELAAANVLGHALHATGRRDEGEAMAREVLAALGGGARLPVAWSVELVLGMALFEAGEPAASRQQLERGLADARALGIPDDMLGWALPTVALAREATGDRTGAAAAVAPAQATPRLPSLASETRARLSILRGDLAAARRWADEARPEASDASPLLPSLEAARALTIARLRLAEGRTEAALAALAEGARRLEEHPWVPERVSHRLLTARARLGGGDRAGAAAAVAEAVELGAPGGYVQRFLDDGRGLDDLLREARAAAPAFVSRVVGEDRPKRPGDRPSVLIADDGRLVEALTRRELDVLRLVARGETNAGLGAALGMSAGTAKWHVAHVLAKLGARSRTQAVVIAQEFDLL